MCRFLDDCVTNCVVSCVTIDSNLLILSIIPVSLAVSPTVSPELYSSYLQRVIIFIPCIISEVIIPSFFRYDKNVLTFLSVHFQRLAKKRIDAGYCPRLQTTSRPPILTFWGVASNRADCIKSNHASQLLKVRASFHNSFEKNLRLSFINPAIVTILL
ncbi:hypothetical protein M067_4672 [Bacteroides fragilis str. J-143-4]|nr:hypothetical protein M067_4672 [Bacteroides fragilis str. J-143-4]